MQPGHYIIGENMLPYTSHTQARSGQVGLSLASTSTPPGHLNPFYYTTACYYIVGRTFVILQLIRDGYKNN